MKTIINAKVLMAALLMLVLAATTVRADSLFRIVEGMDDARLRGVMENNVATMLATFNTAASISSSWCANAVPASSSAT